MANIVPDPPAEAVEFVARDLCRKAGHTHPDEDWRVSLNGEAIDPTVGAVPPGRSKRWQLFADTARDSIVAWETWKSARGDGR